MENQITEDAPKRTLFKIEVFGYIKYFDMGETTLSEIKKHFIESEHPYVDFEKFATCVLTEWDHAALEQSDKVFLSVKADIDNDVLEVYETNGIAEDYRTIGENANIWEVGLSEYMSETEYNHNHDIGEDYQDYGVESDVDKEEKNYVSTNIGDIPLEDYMEMRAIQYGFDSYSDMLEEGYSINIAQEQTKEKQTEKEDLHEETYQSSKESNTIEQFKYVTTSELKDMLNQQGMQEQSQGFKEFLQYASGMQMQLDVMAKELRAVRGQLEELQAQNPKYVTHNFIDKVTHLCNKVIDLSERMHETEKSILKIAAQAIITFKEKGREEMSKVVLKGISSIKAAFESHRKSVADVMADYEKTAKQIDSIGNELKQIGNSFSNVGRLITGKETKEVSDEKPGVAFTRAINKPIKNAVGNLRQNIEEIDKTLAKLDKMSERLSVKKENTSLLGKLSQKNEEAKKNNNDRQSRDIKEKSTEKGIG